MNVGTLKYEQRETLICQSRSPSGDLQLKTDSIPQKDSTSLLPTPSSHPDRGNLHKLHSFIENNDKKKAKKNLRPRWKLASVYLRSLVVLGG